MTISLRARASLPALGLLAACLIGASVPQVRASEPGSSTTLAEWSKSIWATATEGQGDQALERILQGEKLPGEPTSLASDIAKYKVDAQKSAASRLARIGELKKDLGDADAKGELLDGLRAAIELYTLSPDKSEVLNDPMVKSLEAKALAQAKEKEAAGEWLDSHGLYTRLHLLHEVEGTYKPDLKRLGTRILMIRSYLPARLHEMRSKQRVAEGFEPLPAYNPIGDDWQTRLAGIDDRIVLMAINAAISAHVERVPASTILLGAINQLRTMATTKDLAEAFPGIGEADKNAAFLSTLDQIKQKVEADPKAVDFYGVMRALRDISKANAASLGLPSEALLHEFGNGGMGTLDDYSEIIWPDELRTFSRTTQGEFPGVGIQITLDDAMQLKVVTPLEGTPAAKAGIRPSDIIRKIDGKDTTGIALQQAVDLITGPEGTKVVLSVERNGQDGTLDFELSRAKIPVHSVKGWKRTGPGEMDWDWFVDREKKIGYVRLTQFSKDTTSDLVAAVRSMMKTGLNGLILDLRYNPGGLLDEAVNVNNLFVDEGEKLTWKDAKGEHEVDGVIVSQQDAKGQEHDVQKAKRGQAFLADMPTVVLINEGSASASEIVSGCLQDYHKAVLLGDRSFGKGSVQNVFPIGEKAAFKLTTMYYKLPKGRLVHRRDGAKDWGVNPDIKVEMLPEQIDQSLILRQDADVFQLDDNGKPVPQMVRAPKAQKLTKGKPQPDHTPVGPADPDRLLTENMDPQLNAALLLLHTRIAGADGTKTVEKP